MGTFERIRTLSPWILTAFAVVFILFMALADADIGGLTSATNNPQTMAIAVVNGEEIKYIDYEKNVTQEIENKRQQNPDAPIDEKQVRTQMWSTMINGQIVEQYSKKVGAYVTDEVVAFELLNNPPDFMKQRFTDSAGNFQSQTYIELLTDPQAFYTQRAPDMDPAEKQKALKQFRDEINMITAYLKDQKQQQLLTNAVNTSTGIVSKTFARQSYIDENTTSDVVFIQLPAASVSDDQINITDEELKAYYEKNKNR
ncbi:MAG: SurA N-terminal domain-containing protein, partial [Candidatus Kapaibacterium sp.]